MSLFRVGFWNIGDVGGWNTVGETLVDGETLSSRLLLLLLLFFFFLFIYLFIYYYHFFFKFSQLPLGWSSCLRCRSITKPGGSPSWKRAKEASVLKSWNWEKRGSEWPIENFEGIIVISSWCRYLLYWVVSTSKKLTWREWLIRYFLPKQRVGMT